MGETVTTRVDDEMAKDVDYFARQEKVDRSTITRKLLASALEEKKLEYALEMYKKGEITIGRAAEIAKKDIREIMLIASKRGISFQYSLKELREDFEAVKKAK